MKRLAAGRLGGAMALCLLGYAAASLPVIGISGQFVHAMMVWNVLLAMLPLLFASLAVKRLDAGRRAAGMVFALLWLLFFPNGPYMVTDIIHLSGSPFYTHEMVAGTVYTRDLVQWMRLLHIGLGIVLGTAAGMRSLYTMHRFAIRRWGGPAAFAMLAAVCLLGGYGIYIGRFLRLNSWDIIMPLSLAGRLIRDFDGFALRASLLYAAYVLLCYGALCAFFYNQPLSEEGTNHAEQSCDPKHPGPAQRPHL